MKRLILILLFFLSKEALASPTEVRVAILENLKIEKLSTDKYATDYMDGIELAKKSALKGGYRITVETFFYGKEPLAILNKVPEVLAWNPDLVIGPRTSSLFLMLKDYLKDVMVLSPFATANAVDDLPKNFRSMTLPNRYFTQAVVNLVREKFPKKAVAPVVEIDCKNCMDFADEFAKVSPSAGVVTREASTYLNKNVETVDLNQLLTHVQSGDLLLVPNTSYTSGAIIPRIANQLKRDELIVIGGDGWGDWTSSYVGKVKSSYLYSGYRVTPWSLDSQGGMTRHMVAEHKVAKGSAPTGPATLLAYVTLGSAIDVLPKGGLGKKAQRVKSELLKLFQDKVASEPNYGRPTSYAIYKVTQDGESFVGEVSALETEKK